jgi:hypothetical protein
MGLDAFAHWLPHGAHSVKTDDAHLLLDALPDALRESATPDIFIRPLETPAWDRLYGRIAAENLGRRQCQAI